MDRTTIVVVAVAMLVVTNIISFALMGHDKKCAQRGKWRVPERALFLATAFFGGLGGVLGMKVFTIRPSIGISRCSSQHC